jgi:methylmalonyl-CoA mutase
MILQFLNGYMIEEDMEKYNKAREILKDAEDLSDEALRDRADACSTRPKIFLATLGTVADYTARAMFAKNLFEAGGIEAVIHDSGDLRDAFAASGATLACLVSSDAIYAEQAVAAAKALAPKAAKTYLAGRPGDLETALKEAGVSGFIYVGCDLIEVLTEALNSV